MFCPKCGRQARPDELFCSRCGTRLIRPKTAASAEKKELPRSSTVVPYGENPYQPRKTAAYQNERSSDSATSEPGASARNGVKSESNRKVSYAAFVASTALPIIPDEIDDEPELISDSKDTRKSSKKTALPEKWLERFRMETDGKRTESARKKTHSDRKTVKPFRVGNEKPRGTKNTKDAFSDKEGKARKKNAVSKEDVKTRVRQQAGEPAKRLRSDEKAKRSHTDFNSDVRTRAKDINPTAKSERVPAKRRNRNASDSRGRLYNDPTGKRQSGKAKQTGYEERSLIDRARRYLRRKIRKIRKACRRARKRADVYRLIIRGRVKTDAVRLVFATREFLSRFGDRAKIAWKRLWRIVCEKKAQTDARIADRKRKAAKKRRAKARKNAAFSKGKQRTNAEMRVKRSGGATGTKKTALALNSKTAHPNGKRTTTADGGKIELPGTVSRKSGTEEKVFINSLLAGDEGGGARISVGREKPVTVRSAATSERQEADALYLETPKRTTKTAQEETPKRIAKTASTETPKRIAKTAPKETPKQIAKTASTETPKRISETAPEETPKRITKTASEETLKRAAKTATAEAPMRAAKRIPKAAEEKLKRSPNGRSVGTTKRGLNASGGKLRIREKTKPARKPLFGALKTNGSIPVGRKKAALAKTAPHRRGSDEETFLIRHLRSAIAMGLLAISVILIAAWCRTSEPGQRLFAQLGLGGAQGYIILGDECMERGNYTRAVEHFYKALTKRTDYDSAIRLANAYRKTGDTARETSALLLCVDQFEEHIEPYRRLKEIYPFSSTRPETVKEALLKGVSLFSDITLAY